MIMKLISNLKYKIQQYILSKNSNKSTVVKAINFEKANKIALIYKVSEKNEKKIKALAEMLRSSKKELIMLGYLKRIKDNFMPATNKNSFIFTDKDLNFLKIPKSNRIAEFLENEYDILLDISDNKTYPISYISSKCKASLKIGFYTPLHTLNFDLMLDSGKTYDIDNFTEQLKQYIHLIDKK